jgi:CHAD domain-containing protein
MAFELKHDESVPHGVRRLVRREIDDALEALTASGPAIEAVHDARKSFKRIRALLRLAREELGTKRYRRENLRFRDLGRRFADVRDAQVLGEALEKLRKGRGRGSRSFAGVRKALNAHCRALSRRALADPKPFQEAVATLRATRKAVRDWPLRHREWAALRDGLKRIYRAGCRAFAAAVAEPTVENLHEWRKQVKYWWHQLQVLEPIRAEVLKEWTDEVHRLADLLGEDHDLAMLRNLIWTDPDAFGSQATIQKLLKLIDERRIELQEEAVALGRVLYAEKPKALLGRLHAYWKEWRGHSREPALPVTDSGGT